MRWVDDLLNKFTMYRVVLYGLRIIVGWSVVLSIFGLLPFSPINLIFSFCFIVAICYVANRLFAKIFNVQTNIESYTITALILYLILIPVNSLESAVIFIVAGTVAMASKYLIVVNRRHIFNPAAFALVVIGIIGSGQGGWWVGSKFMFPAVLIIGLLIVRKVKRFHLFFSFLAASLLTFSAYAFLNKSDQITLLPQIVLSYPILFLGTVMLTEPLTTPPTKKLQMIYGALVGFLSSVQFHFGPIYSTAELALVLGNIFSYIVSFKYRLILTLREKKQIGSNIYEFMFSPSHRFAFSPGQYLEWTLAHKHADRRGNRRYFTIASSPTEDKVKIGVKMDPFNSSSFKKELLDLKDGAKIYAGELSGDFVLPKNTSSKLVFVAGGIGVTPFRSMAQFLIDKSEKRDIVLFYVCSDSSEFVFEDIFEKASDFGLKTVYVCSKPPAGWKGKTGRIDSKMIKEEVPDYKDRSYYLSGPNSMVEAYKGILSGLGIRSNKIVTDYFPGY